jgi:hypothetical protein
MEARATFRQARIPTGVVLLFIAALLAALLLGGAGGYLVRVLTAPATVTTTTVDTAVPRHTEGIPYSTPLPVNVSPRPDNPTPPENPNGYVKV